MSNDNEDLRDLARALFASEPGNDQPDPTPPERGNHSPREGNNPNPGPGDDMAAFVAALFDRAHHQA